MNSRSAVRRWLTSLHPGFAILASSLLSLFPFGANSAYSQEVYDSQPITTPLLTPQEALKSIRPPEGFQVDLFASEPQVQQPIGMAWDAKGRLWVAENYTYAESSLNFDKKLNDRIIILEDTDHDGKADVRKVFWDQAKLLSSVEVGLGGVWALCPPNLLFIPDRNHDDIPDGPPEVVLNGFDDDRVRHNLVNGLRWGPDGWLYGRHGILATSRVGRPDQSDFERRAINCSIWRYHPITREFDVVSEGTTNSWGMDWDQHGHLFFINTVIGHLWHALPGSHLQRMYGEDLDPNIYQLMPQIADHVHWNSAGEEWSSIRTKGVTPETDKAGGGHAHVGMMIYQGTNWPESYRNELFTLNLHGRRINQEHLEREGAGFIGKHRDDFFFVGDPWYRGIELSAGPDGSVLVLDWSDIGECHENDGVHRGSGRIYRLRHGNLDSFSPKDWSTASDAELVTLLKRPDAWHRRTAKQLLAERHLAGTLSKEAILALRHGLKPGGSKRDRLESLWALYACQEATVDDLSPLLSDPDESLRLWGMKLLLDRPTSDPNVGKMIADLLKNEKSDLVRLYAAGLIAQVRGEGLWDSIESLVQQPHLAKDRDYPLMVWCGIKEHVAREPERGIRLIAMQKIPILAEFIARRVSAELDSKPKVFNALIASLAEKELSEETRSRVLDGIGRALRGRRKVPAPDAWANTVKVLESHKDAPYLGAVSRLGVTFGQGVAVDQIRAMVTDGGLPKSERRDALASLVEAQVPGLAEVAWQIAGDRDLAPAAMKALAAVGSVDDANEMVKRFKNSPPETKIAIIQALSGNRKFVGTLLDSVQDQRIAATEIDAATLRQMQMMGDAEITKRLGTLWPQVRLIAGNKVEQIQKLEQKLTPAELGNANLVTGKALWEKTCASCHRLYGEGGQIGPDLTGAQRSNLRYVLENVVDPSASVVDRFRVTFFVLNDGQVMTGVPLQEDDKTVTIQTVKEKVVLLKVDIEKRKPSEQSLMPEGLLDSLEDAARRDLIAYIMSSK